MSEEEKKAEVNVEKKVVPKPTEKPKQIAVVRIRGSIRVKEGVKITLNMLRLYRRNYCVVVSATPSILGMLQKIKDYVTWGEINDETLKLLQEKRGKKNKKFFALHPPRGGFKRKGIKFSFKAGGALGNRKEKINDLIKKMI